LERALALAGPEGYARVFIDEGRPMQKLLTDWLSAVDAGPLIAYARHLTAQFVSPAAATTRQEKLTPNDLLIEPLSRREMEVLTLIALGKTNKEISAELVVSPGTIKAHTSSIYRKLDVANRTEAVARARDLKILS
jgi:LuxR family maltose regulon positive regulatory protein